MMTEIFDEMMVEEMMVEEIFEEFEEDSEEYQKYLNDIEEWFEDVIETIEEPAKQYKVLRPVLKPIKNFSPCEENDMVIIGSVTNVSKKIKTSFKYNVFNKNIFCNSLKGKSKCNGCKYAHTFTDIPYCIGKCGRIILENNFYFGNCNKRHSQETLENFLIRKGIQLNTVREADFKIFDHPSKEFVREILERAKSLKFTSVSFTLINRSQNLEEFLEKNRQEQDDIYNNVLTDEEFNELWK